MILYHSNKPIRACLPQSGSETGKAGFGCGVTCAVRCFAAAAAIWRLQTALSFALRILYHVRHTAASGNAHTYIITFTQLQAPADQPGPPVLCRPKTGTPLSGRTLLHARVPILSNSQALPASISGGRPYRTGAVHGIPRWPPYCIAAS